ncbi:WD40 repeat domain-containing protein, partial [Roseiflexus sp.]
YDLLTDFDFLEARFRATTVFDLEADYRQALASWPPEDAARRDVLAAFEERVRLEASRIAQAPEWLFPALYNYLRWLGAPDGPLHRSCEAAVARRQGQNGARPPGQSNALPLLLRSRLDPQPEPPLWLRSLEGHTHWVSAVALSPDGRTIVSGSRDCTVKVWDNASGRLLRSLDSHTDWVRAVAFSPDGRTIVSGADDGTVKVWDASTGRLLRSPAGHTDRVRAVALSPDGRTIVSGGSFDRTVKVWDARDGRLRRSLEDHTDAVTAVALSPDGRTISGSRDRTVRGGWDPANRVLRVLFWNDADILSLALSGDGQLLACGDEVGRVWIFDVVA